MSALPILPALCVLLLPVARVAVGQEPKAELPDAAPEPAIGFVLQALLDHDVVAIAEDHWNATEHAFLRELIAHPDLPARVQDVVIEFGNSLHQATLDRYLRGEAVPFEELCLVWRDTAASPVQTWDATVYHDLLATVRRVNEQLPAARRLRVWASGRPVDWSVITSAADLRPYLDRTRFPARLTYDEVLRKGRKALLLRGGAHLIRRPSHPGMRPSVAQLLVEQHGAKLLSIALWRDREGRMPEVERRVADWPVPSIARIEGSWLADLPAEPFFMLFRPAADGTMVPAFQGEKLLGIYDAVLYLGPSDAMQAAAADPERESPEYRAELERRRRIRRL